MRDLNPRHPAPKAGALPGCANPRHSYLTVFLASAHDTDHARFSQSVMTRYNKNIRDQLPYRCANLSK